jgi:Holliday junction resolvase RusA-like endonuclease
MSESVTFTVPGVPAPGGSKTPYRNKHTGKVALVDAGKNNAGWKQRVAVFASQAMAGREPLEGPLFFIMLFRMPRPKGHYGTGRNAATLKPWAEKARPIGKPDTTKLVRAAEDALKGIIWHDDSQVVMQSAGKVYGDVPGLEVTVEVIEP